MKGVQCLAWTCDILYSDSSFITLKGLVTLPHPGNRMSIINMRDVVIDLPSADYSISHVSLALVTRVTPYLSLVLLPGRLASESLNGM